MFNGRSTEDTNDAGRMGAVKQLNLTALEPEDAHRSSPRSDSGDNIFTSSDKALLRESLAMSSGVDPAASKGGSGQRRQHSSSGRSHDVSLSAEYLQDIINKVEWVITQAVDRGDSQLEKPENKDLIDTYSTIRTEDFQLLAKQNVTGGQSLLHNAVCVGIYPIAKHLIENGFESLVDVLNEHDPEQSPLTYSVQINEYKGFDPRMLDLLLPHSRHPVDVLCEAIRQYEENTERNTAVFEAQRRLLDELLVDARFVGRPNDKNSENDEDSNNFSCLDEPGGPLELTPLQMASCYRDKILFIKLMQLILENVQNEDFILQRDHDNNTLLHLAVRYAIAGDERDNDFVEYLLKNFSSSDLGFERQLARLTNNEQQTVLSLACSQRNLNLIALMAINDRGYRIDLDKVSFETALIRGYDDVLALLLQLWPDAGRQFILAGEPCPYQRVLQLSRTDLLEAGNAKRLEDGDTEVGQVEWARVQRVLLKFLFSAENIAQGQQLAELKFKAARNSLEGITDTQLNTRMNEMLNLLQSDYQQLITDLKSVEKKLIDSDSFVRRIDMILGLVSELHQVSDSFSPQKKLTPQQKEQARTEFAQCCRQKLYSENIKALVGEVICLLAGLIVGGLIGFVVGTLATGGGPGGFWLAQPTAKYGAALGLACGAMIGGAIGGVGRYQLSDTCKWHRGFWALNRAMNKNIKETVMSESDLNRLTQTSSDAEVHSGDESAYDF